MSKSALTPIVLLLALFCAQTANASDSAYNGFLGEYIRQGDCSRDTNHWPVWSRANALQISELKLDGNYPTLYFETNMDINNRFGWQFWDQIEITDGKKAKIIANTGFSALSMNSALGSVIAVSDSTERRIQSQILNENDFLTLKAQILTIYRHGIFGNSSRHQIQITKSGNELTVSETVGEKTRYSEPIPTVCKYMKK